MKKKFILILFTFVAFFSLIINTNAVTCKYKDEKRHELSFNVTLSIDGYTVAERAKLVGFNELIKGEEVQNWTKAYYSNNFVGREYYKEEEKCPPIVLVSDTNKGDGLDVYVSDVDSKSDLISEIVRVKKITNKSILELSIIIDTGDDTPKDSDAPTSCLDFDEETCETNEYFACVWNTYGKNSYCNVDKLLYVKCGDAVDIPKEAPQIISLVINLFKIAAPIILILVSVINLLKALASSSEDEITKARKKLVKKIFPAIMVFFVISIVQFVILKVADSSEEGSITSCFSCFLNNDCGKTIYYKTNIYGVEVDKYLDGSKAPMTDKDSDSDGSKAPMTDKDSGNEHGGSSGKF